jgi:hypothetical protein
VEGEDYRRELASLSPSLHPNEVELLQRVGLLPSQYKALKEAIVRGVARDRVQGGSPEQVDAIFDLCVTLGWVMAPGADGSDNGIERALLDEAE